jgi:hypothetical protein
MEISGPGRLLRLLNGTQHLRQWTRRRLWRVLHLRLQRYWRRHLWRVRTVPGNPVVVRPFESVQRRLRQGRLELPEGLPQIGQGRGLKRCMVIILIPFHLRTKGLKL